VPTIGQILADAAALADNGQLTPREFEFGSADSVMEAYEAIETGTAHGKIVINVAA
jgi:hypothetical protein